MKKLFKKYYNSLLHPDEFSEISAFVRDKKNESVIFKLMKPFWEKEINETNVSSVTNPVLFKRIKKAIFVEKQKAAQRKIKIYIWGMRIAAVLIIALLASNIFFFQKSVEDQFAKNIQTITTPYGAKTNITLPDGSLVWLNSGSTLSYPIKFSKNRSVTLVGEAFFNVEKNGNPFIVLNIIDIKMAPFNRYQTLDVVRGVIESGREDNITLYTCNDDNIVVDLLTEYRITNGTNSHIKPVVGGLLGHWAVWNRSAVKLLDKIKKGELNHNVKGTLLLASQVTDTNAAFFDAANNFSGCIVGLHEVLRRQSLLEGLWTLDENEVLSPGQKEEIDRVYDAYPELNDDLFVAENKDRWLS